MAQGGTPKIPRKSTHIDMTAFCDVSFLLLTFFMLATKFKAPEPVEIAPPNSVSTKIVPDDNIILILFDSTGRVFLSIDKFEQKINLLSYMNQEYGLGLSSQEIVTYANEPSFGVSMRGIKPYLEGKYDGVALPGIPVNSTDNELVQWVASLGKAYGFKTKRPDILIKGDAKAGYPTFSLVIDAFKRNRLFSFKLVTGQEPVPKGTPLYATNIKLQESAISGEK